MFGNKHAPWENSIPIDQVVESLRPQLVKLQLIEPGDGYTDSELDKLESRSGDHLPNEIRLFYRTAKPKRFELDDWPPVGFFTVDDEDVKWYDFIEDPPHPLEMILEPAIEQEDPGLATWRNAKLFMLGGTPYFDRFFAIQGHPSIADGTLLFTAHEDEKPLIVVARSLAEYLQRLAFFDGVDLACYPGQEGIKHRDRKMDHRYIEDLNANLWNPYGE